MSLPEKIGILDWGIGGISVYRALRATGSTIDVVYLSDSGNKPYGKHTLEELRRRLAEVAEFFVAHGVSRVLVACNSASSALARDSESIGGVRFDSIVPAGVAVARRAAGARVGVIGSDLTIGSKVYEQRLSVPGRKFVFTSAQPLSALVERGELSGDPVARVVGAVLERLGAIDSLLLACTHYPALVPAIHQLRPGLELLDPAGAMVSGLPREGKGSLSFYTTGSGALSRTAARSGFGVELEVVHELGIDLAECRKPSIL